MLTAIIHTAGDSDMAAQPLPTQPEIEAAATIVPVRDVPTSAAFYRDVLGWEIRDLSPNRDFCIIIGGSAAFCLIATTDEKALEATRSNISAYVWVKGVNELYWSLKSQLDALPEDRVRPPFTQDYGMREFHVKDPDGFLILFGEEAEEE
jgi:catechol 2,3-dioxygenase-like lactoylglutathione lyase family enzyme